jgi:hypothetical protein
VRNHAAFEQSGILAFNSANLTIQGGSFAWDGGQFSGTGQLALTTGATGTFNTPLNVPSGLTLTLSSSEVGGQLISNDGSMIVNDSTVANALDNAGAISVSTSLAANLQTLNVDALDDLQFKWSGFELNNLDLNDDGVSDYSTPVFVENVVQFLNNLLGGDEVANPKPVELRRGKLPVQRVPTADEREAGVRITPLLDAAAEQALRGDLSALPDEAGI